MQLILEFEVVPADVDEEALTLSDPWETARQLALAKAQTVALHRPDALVIGSDTVVAIEVAPDHFQQLAKPRDEADAVKMLHLLSGRDHTVITGVALVHGTSTKVEADTTIVRFRDLSEEEVRDYVATGEPMDKAGAYAIQGGASGFVSNTRGSITNVIGLPLELLSKMLSQV